MAALITSSHQLLPDIRQIFDVSTEHVDALRACDFHIQAVLFCYVALHSNASRELGPGPCARGPQDHTALMATRRT